MFVRINGIIDKSQTNIAANMESIRGVLEQSHELMIIIIIIIIITIIIIIIIIIIIYLFIYLYGANSTRFSNVLCREKSAKVGF